MTKELKYFEGIGRRKEASARVRLSIDGTETKGVFIVNKMPYVSYFKLVDYQSTVYSPLKSLGTESKKVKIEGKVMGGGLKGQAEAIRLGLARAIVKWNPGLKAEMRSHGYLTRDARIVERKKYGLRKARRAQQWRKR